MNILGVNCFMHDTAACLVKDGELIAFGEEERFNRNKHTTEFPYQAIAWCMKEGHLGVSEVDVVTLTFKPWLCLVRGLGQIITYCPLVISRYKNRFAHSLCQFSRKSQIKDLGIRAPVHHVGHHASHLASAFFVSPFREAALLSIDGGGDFVSTTLAFGRDNSIKILKEIRNPHSVGDIYSAITDYLGFRPYSDEGKVMGLAPYGKPRFIDQFRQMVSLKPDGSFRIDPTYFGFAAGGWVTDRFVEVLGPPRGKGESLDERHADIAASVQQITEEVVFHTLRYLAEITGVKKLCLAGGVALNSVTNGKIEDETQFDEVYIIPACGDAGTALGSALWFYHQVLKNPRLDAALTHAYYGYCTTNEELKAFLDSSKIPYETLSDPASRAAKLIANGAIVGWFQERAEIGPRALGNRSILADPRIPEMKDIMNKRVKHREPFRPFAPSILIEETGNYFEKNHATPFMLHIFQIRKEMRNVIPAVTHVDGSGRLQTVSKEANPLYWQLITEFQKLTGVPVVFNTSFNDKGEPIVNTSKDAVKCFYTTGMDYLIMGNYLLNKKT